MTYHTPDSGCVQDCTNPTPETTPQYLAVFRSPADHEYVVTVTFECNNVFKAPQFATDALRQKYPSHYSMELTRLELTTTTAARVDSLPDNEREALDAAIWHGYVKSSVRNGGLCFHWRIVRKLINRGLLEPKTGEFSGRKYYAPTTAAKRAYAEDGGGS